MIEAIFEGNKYRFCKSNKGNYWLGITGSGGLYPGNHCIAPRCTWPELQTQAIADGHALSDFASLKSEKKEGKKRTVKKSIRPSISIF